ncbi:MAG: hypothetical protein JRF33_21145 [Deltaproteobacteria bacterium]|nr:hypothetical protein [Deltaproteobacteria bacterium]
MNKLFAWVLILVAPVGLAHAEGKLDKLRAAIPDGAALVLELDVAEAFKTYDRIWKHLEEAPLVQQSSALASLLTMQRMGVDTFIEMARDRMGLDPKKDLKLALASLILSPDENPKIVMGIKGKLPVDIIGKIMPAGPSPDIQVQLLDPGPDAVLLAASPSLLPRAVERAGTGKAHEAVKQRHPGIFSKMTPGSMLRLSFAMPPWMRKAATKNKQAPFRSLIEGVSHFEFDLADAAELRLYCTNKPCAARAELLLAGLRDSMMAGTHVIRAYGLLLAGADLGRSTVMPAVARSALGNRKAIKDTLNHLFPRPSALPKVQRQDEQVSLSLKTDLLKGGVFTLGILSAVAIPAFVSYIRKSRMASDKETQLPGRSPR